MVALKAMKPPLLLGSTYIIDIAATFAFDATTSLTPLACAGEPSTPGPMYTQRYASTSA